MFTRKFQVKPTCAGYFYRNSRRLARLAPGVYRFWEFLCSVELVEISLARKIICITNQEVLSKDGIAFRASLMVEYRVADPDRVMDWVDLGPGASVADSQVAQRLHLRVQERLRDGLATMTSEEAFERRGELANLLDAKMEAECLSWGVELIKVGVRDLTFPKSIQDLFSRPLEAKIRAKADLENARTVVATARALKNAAEMTRGDDAVRFLQYLELLEKVAAKGKHTFVIGETGLARPQD